MGAVVIGASVLLQLVDMVLELLAGALRVCAAGAVLPCGGAAWCADADLGGVILPQGQLIAAERDLQRVAQGATLVTFTVVPGVRPISTRRRLTAPDWLPTDRIMPLCPGASSWRVRGELNCCCSMMFLLSEPEVGPGLDSDLL